MTTKGMTSLRIPGSPSESDAPPTGQSEAYPVQIAREQENCAMRFTGCDAAHLCAATRNETGRCRICTAPLFLRPGSGRPVRTFRFRRSGNPVYFGEVAPPSLANEFPSGSLILTSTISIEVQAGRAAPLAPTSGSSASALLLSISISPSSGVEYVNATGKSMTVMSPPVGSLSEARLSVASSQPSSTAPLIGVVPSAFTMPLQLLRTNVTWQGRASRPSGLPAESSAFEQSLSSLACVWTVHLPFAAYA